ncbi:MAG: UDP-N-acetylmuramate--L-alanine ligase [Gemmatimonadetes bacterium]|nr:UDP-N-acetylmuramate--L-alanine ligase [Gemmatimonadota bacterium]
MKLPWSTPRVSPPDLMELVGSSGSRVHFMGVGGEGMSPLAEFMARKGICVSGCDLVDGPALAALREKGVDVSVGHDPAHLEGVCALVVSSAIPPSQKELARAGRRDIPVLKRAQALGSIVNSGELVAVSGTHGKTTTTALTAHVCAELGHDPTAFVGGWVPAWSGNLRLGGSDLFVVEADEYDRSFHELTPDVAVVTNVEADHLDTYGTARGVRRAFATFLRGLKPGGTVIVCADDHGASTLLARTEVKAITYGLAAGSMVWAKNVYASTRGIRCTVMERGYRAGELGLGLSGYHNLRNALAAATVARRLGSSWDDILEALACFEGVKRRFEFVGEVGGAVFIDDYAHHPTEIRATLGAARARFPDRRLVAVFQPHLYSRTRDFASSFGASLSHADMVWITGIYPAREPPIPGVTGEMVATAAETAGHTDVRYTEEIDEMPTQLANELGSGDLLLTLGAGSIESLARKVLKRLEEVPAGASVRRRRRFAGVYHA